MFFVISKETRGRILQTISGPEPLTYGGKLDNADLQWLFLPAAAADHERQYLKVQIADRPQMPLTQDGKTVRGIPEGCSVTIEFSGRQVASETVDDGEIEFSPVTPGTYIARFECWPYLPAKLELTR